MFLGDLEYKKTYIFGLIYTIFLLIFCAIVNYYTWSSAPIKGINIIDIGLWGLFYLPMVIFYRYADWRINDFGFDLNYKVIGLTIILIIVCIIKGVNISFNSWKISLIEMYARIGEEVFFRGFIYMLGIKLFKNKRRPWLWAVIISSICFTVMHTQTFLPEYNSLPLKEILITAVFLSLFRKWTKSILFGIIIHVFVQSNIFSMFSGVVIYYIIALLANKKEVKI